MRIDFELTEDQKTWFGLANGIAPSQVGRYLDYKCLVIEGQILKPIKELKK